MSLSERGKYAANVRWGNTGGGSNSARSSSLNHPSVDRKVTAGIERRRDDARASDKRDRAKRLVEETASSPISKGKPAAKKTKPSAKHKREIEDIKAHLNYINEMPHRRNDPMHQKRKVELEARLAALQKS